MADLITVARAAMVPALTGIDAAYLAVLVSAASNMAIKYCKREFLTATFTDEEYDGDGTTVLTLRQFPITALTNVKTVEDDGTTSTCLGAEFRINRELGEIKPAPDCDCDYCYFPRGYQNIKVTYVAGAATVPEDVQEAVAQIVEWLFSNAGAASNVESWKLGDAAAKYKLDLGGTPMLPATVRMLLAPYRNVSL